MTMQGLQLVADHPLAAAGVLLALTALLARAYFRSTRDWLRRFDELPERRFLSAAELAVLCWPARLDEAGLARAQRFHRRSSLGALALLGLILIGLAARRVVRAAESPTAAESTRAGLERVAELCLELERELAETDGSFGARARSRARASALAERLEGVFGELGAAAAEAEPQVRALQRRAALALSSAREEHEEVLLLAGERELELEARATEEQIERELALLLARARALKGLDRAQRALEVYERALALRPQRAELRLARAELRAQLGRESEALEELRELLAAGALPSPTQVAAARSRVAELELELEVERGGAPPPAPERQQARAPDAAPAAAPVAPGAPAAVELEVVAPQPSPSSAAGSGAPAEREEPLADAPGPAREHGPVDASGDEARSGAELFARLESLRARGAPREAAEAVAAALGAGVAAHEAQAGEAPAREEAQLLRASLHHLRARCRLELSELELALADCDAALLSLASEERAGARFDEERALVLQTRGRVHARAARLAEAEADFDAAIALWRELAGGARGRGHRPSLARALADRGRAAFNRHDLGRARLDLDEALEILGSWVEHEGGRELASELEALRRERALALGGERDR